MLNIYQMSEVITIEHCLKRPIQFLRIKNLCHLSYDVCCNNLPL